MGVSSLPKTATRQRRDCDSNPCSSEPESGTLTTRPPDTPYHAVVSQIGVGAIQWPYINSNDKCRTRHMPGVQ